MRLLIVLNARDKKKIRKIRYFLSNVFFGIKKLPTLIHRMNELREITGNDKLSRIIEMNGYSKIGNSIFFEKETFKRRRFHFQVNGGKVYSFHMDKYKTDQDFKNRNKHFKTYHTSYKKDDIVQKEMLKFKEFLK
jgi:uncharacterized protein YkuJ